MTADSFRRPVLTWALDPALVKLLLDRKDIDVNKKDNQGYTALWRAACSNRFEIAKLLLDRDDIDVNLSDMGGRTPLFHACHCSHLSIVRLLLKKDGIDPNARDNDGCTPLARACHLDCLAFVPLRSHLAVVRSLLSHPDTDPNVDNNGVSILAYVIDNVTPRYGEEIESLLRTAGASRWRKVVEIYMRQGKGKENTIIRVQRTLPRYSSIKKTALCLCSFHVLALECPPCGHLPRPDWSILFTFQTLFLFVFCCASYCFLAASTSWNRFLRVRFVAATVSNRLQINFLHLRVPALRFAYRRIFSSNSYTDRTSPKGRTLFKSFRASK